MAFENLYRIVTITNRQPDEGDDDMLSTQRLVALHADINDKGQTVSIMANDLASDRLATLMQTGAVIGLGISTATIAGIGTYRVIKNRYSRR